MVGQFGTCVAFDHRFVRDRVDGDSLLEEPEEQFASATRFSSVEAEGEFVQVIVQVLQAHCSLVCAHQPPLEEVPVGAFLSGGADSSSIVALMSEAAKSNVHTLTVSFGEAGSRDAAIARSVAQRFGTRHTEIPMSASGFLPHMFDWLASQDQPSADGANTWIISRACRQAGLKVALSGLGADELFAGYSTFSRMKMAARFSPALSWVPMRLRQAMARAIAPADSGTTALEKLAEWLPGDGSRLSAYLTIRRIFPSAVSRRLLDPVFPFLAPSDLHPAVARHLQQTRPALDVIAATSRFEINTYLTSTLLRDSDQMGMARSLEIRVPFVDARLAELALSIPGDAHTAQGPKTILRAAMAGSLDRSWTDRPKEGFTLPFDSWLRNDLRNPVEEVLMGLSDFPFRPEQIARFWFAFQSGNRQAVSGRVLTLLALGAWMKRHRVETCV